MAVAARRPAAGVQKALYQRLTAAGLAVYDHVDETAEGVYVTIGEISTESARNAHDRFGRDTTVWVHVWDRQRTWDRANAAADDVVRLVDHQPMTVPGHHVVSVKFEFGQNFWDEDPEIRHVALRFRVTTEQEE